MFEKILIGTLLETAILTIVVIISIVREKRYAKKRNERYFDRYRINRDDHD